MAFSPNTSNQWLETLPAGFPSYLRTLAVMAALVKQSVTNYGLKLFANSLLQRSGINGHDFSGEIAALFFSFGIRCVIRATRWTLSLCRAQRKRWKRLQVIVTTKLRFFARFSHCKALCRALLLAAERRTLQTTFGAKCILTGKTNGYRLTRPTNRQHPAGKRIFPTDWNMKSGKMRIHHAY